MGNQQQDSAVVGPQIDEMFPDRIARNGGQSDGRFIEKQHTWPMQSGLGDFQTANHAAGVLAHHAPSIGRQSYELMMFANTRL